MSVEEKLKALYDLQCVDSEIDQLRVVRGELPVEIQDLEDEISRLETRLEKFEEKTEDHKRCRMRKSSYLMIIAEMSDGRIGLEKKYVDVMLGACS